MIDIYPLLFQKYVRCKLFLKASFKDKQNFVFFLEDMEKMCMAAVLV